MIFDTISVKARWERWCRWNCDLMVIRCTKKGIFCRTESVAMTPKSCAHMRTTSLWGVELRSWSWYLARETHKDTAVSVWACQAGFWKSTRTSCQQHICQNWQYGLVSKPFSSPQMIMYRSAFCIGTSQLKCLVWSKCFVCFYFHSAAWSNMTDPWQKFSEAEFQIFLCTTIEIIIIYYFQGCE